MPQFNNLDEMFRYVEREAVEVVRNEVAQEVIELAKYRVDTDVYDQYTPKKYGYKRTGELRKSFKKYNIKNGVSIINDRKDKSRNVAYIVESGEGYEYTSADGYDTTDENGMTYEVPRPFMENTYKDIMRDDILHRIIKAKLKAKGIEVVV